MRMKSRTRYLYPNGIRSVIVVSAKGKGYWHNEDNTKSTPFENLTVDDWITAKHYKEITYHQYIMWLCFGEPIVV